MDTCVVNSLGRQRWYVLLEQRLSMYLPIIRQGCSQVQHKLVWVDIHVAHSYHTHEGRGLENWYTWHCWSCPKWQSWVFVPHLSLVSAIPIHETGWPPSPLPRKGEPQTLPVPGSDVLVTERWPVTCSQPLALALVWLSTCLTWDRVTVLQARG